MGRGEVAVGLGKTKIKNREVLKAVYAKWNRIHRKGIARRGGCQCVEGANV